MIRILIVLAIATAVTAQGTKQFCEGQDDRTLLPIPGNCTHYCSCKDQKDYILPCGKEFLFDQDRNVCDYPNKVPTCTTTCTSNDTVHNQPAARSCREYFVCLLGSPMLQDCGEGYAYDKSAEKCNLAEFVDDCEASTKPPEPEKNPCEGASDGVKVPGSTCPQFWWCLSGQPVEPQQNCSAGLHFSPAMKECMTPEEAGCKITYF